MKVMDDAIAHDPLCMHDAVISLDVLLYLVT
jgi:hypothetical protein